MRCTFRNSVAVAAVLSFGCFAHAQGGCDDPLTQNASQDLTVGGVACQDAGITTPNSYCRSFSLLSGQDYQISCVSFGIANSGSDLDAQVNVYTDTDGGAPQAPGADLTLLASADYVHFTTAGNEMVNVNFSPPVCIQPDTVFVVEISIPASTDGFATFAGNADTETGPTYIYSADCGLTAYTPMADIGFPDNRWVLTVVGGYGCDASNTCDCTITSNCQIVRPEPGCEDALCEAIVCGQEPFCCEVEWDAYCVELSALCGASGFPCDLPSNNLTEAEVCGEDTNGGCNMKIPAYEDIAVGDSVAGTFFVSTAADVRDTDWYSFTLTEKSIVTWTAYSTIPCQTLLINDLCGEELLIVGAGSGDCPSSLEACLDAGTYRAFVAPVGGSDLPCGTAGYDEYVAVLNATPTDGCPGFDDCPSGNIELTQNSDIAITDGGIACGANGITAENWFARSYDLSQGDTAGVDVEISCVQYGVQNTGSQVPSKAQIWLVLDGQVPGGDKELLCERETVAASAVFDMQVAAFDPPCCVPADSVILVALYFDPSTDGFVSFAGNLTAADGPTYIKSDSCGITEWIDLADIGFPDNQWVQIVVANDACGGGGTPCPGDFNDDGAVDGGDFGTVLAAWGSCPGCPQDLNADNEVNGADVGLMLSYWGDCPQDP